MAGFAGCRTGRLIWLIGLAAALCACSARSAEEADRAERALQDMQGFAGKYGPDKAIDVYARRPGTGALANSAVTCGKTMKGISTGSADGPRRAIVVGGAVVREGAIGQSAGLFAELWRRAGC